MGDRGGEAQRGTSNTATGAAARLALGYALVAALWILLSDQALVWLFGGHAGAVRVGMLKGWLFVLVTAGLLFVVLRRELRRWELEAALRREAERHRTADARELERMQALYAALSRINEGLARAGSRAEACRVACEVATREAGFALAVVYLRDEGHTHLEPVAHAGEAAGYVFDLHGDDDVSDALAGRAGPVAECVRSGAACVHDALPPREGATPAWRDVAAKHRLGAVAALPIRLHGVVRGAYAVYAREPGSLGAPEVALLADIAADLSFALEAQEAGVQLRQLSRAVEQSPVAIVITDTKARIEYVNPRFCAVTGYRAEEVLGRNPRILKSGKTTPEEYRALWETITRGGEWSGELRNRRKGGELFWEAVTISPIFDDAGRITHYLAVKEDITERKKLEEQLRHAQKMEALGVLAGGVAHDFNNLLTVISGGASLQLEPDTGMDEQRELAAQIAGAAERAAALTRQLLLYSRKQALRPQDVDLNAVVHDLARMLRRLLREDVTLKLECAPALPSVRGDVGMLEQVVLNLAVNARDAMPSGGTLTIRTEVRDLETPPEGAPDDAVAGRYVAVSVVDTGTGVAPEALPHLFEPFFTTKDVGAGTGLGLATVYGIVQQHRGAVSVESRPGEGALFRVLLPATDPPTATSTLAPVPPFALRGTETVLLVEDDPALRRTAASILARQGYTVLEAASGVAASAVWQAERSRIDLLVTDVVMPGGVNGLSLAARLRAEKPGLAVVYTSGYTAGADRGAELLVEGTNFLPKPYTAGRLAAIVRGALDARARGAQSAAASGANVKG